MNTEKTRAIGVDVENIPNIDLDISGVAGKMMAKWKIFRVHLTSEETGETHLQEIYLSDEVRDELMSYKTQNTEHSHI